MSDFRLNLRSEQDLERIADYLGKQNVAAAVKVLERLTEKFEFLADFPGAGQVDERFGKGIRIFPAGSYVIYYVARKSGVEIMRVIHGARDIRSLDQE